MNASLCQLVAFYFLESFSNLEWNAITADLATYG
jgi:hypothetical protein